MFDSLKGHHILGRDSKTHFDTLHPVLQVLVLSILDRMDVKVVEGFRPEELQNKYFSEGSSSVKWPNGAHNKKPSEAVDLAPYIRGKGTRWDSREVAVMMGRIQEIADVLNIPIIWGGDWDGDGDITEHNLQDLVHLELDMKKLQKTVWKYLKKKVDRPF